MRNMNGEEHLSWNMLRMLSRNSIVKILMLLDSSSKLNFVLCLIPLNFSNTTNVLIAYQMRCLKFLCHQNLVLQVFWLIRSSTLKKGVMKWFSHYFTHSPITLITIFYFFTISPITYTSFIISHTWLLHIPCLLSYPLPQNILSYSSNFYTSLKLSLNSI